MMSNNRTADTSAAVPPVIEDKPTPGEQTRPLTPEEDLDHAVEETFPASDPISPSRIDTPST
jgi:hypothetical protein